MGFSRQEYWSGSPFPSPGDLHNPGIESRSPTLQADSLLAEPPGKPKNTGLGSHSLLQRNFKTQGSNWGLLYCRQILYQLSYPASPSPPCCCCKVTSVMSDSVQPHRREPTRLPRPWDSPGQNTGVGSLLQGIFPTQGSNPGVPHCRQILYQLSHRGSPRILDWVAYPFSRESSRRRNQTRVSSIAGNSLPTELSGKP